MRKAVALLLLAVVVCVWSSADAQEKKRRRQRETADKPDKHAAAKVEAMPTEKAIADLPSADPDVAAKAAASLGAGKSLKSSRAQDALLDALALGLHPTVAAAALEALAQRGSSNALDTIEYYTTYRNPKVRAAAITAAGSMKDARATELVLGGLHDFNDSVRAAAADVIRHRKLKQGIEPLIELVKRGDEAAAPALAAMADADLARIIAEQIGTAPDGVLARCLGAILMRPDFKPEDARVQVVHALGKIPGNEALEQLTNYIGSVPEKPARQSRRDAETILEQRLGGTR